MKKLLPFHPCPINGESHRGYLLRVSTGNGYANAHWLSRVPGFAQFMTQGLGRALGGRKTNWTLSGDTDPSAKDFGGSPFVQTIESRFCPLCISEYRFWRVEWEWTYYVACHYHGVRLVSTCSACGGLQTTTRRMLLQCNCGASLSRQPNSPADLAEVAISLQLLDIQRGRPASCEDSLSPIGTIIGKHDFESVCRFIRTIGRRHGAAKADVEDTRSLIANLPIAREHVINTAQVLHDWPSNFVAFLLKYGELENAAPSTYSRSKKFNILLRKLPWSWTDTSTPLSNVISDVLARYEPRVLDGRQGHVSAVQQLPGRFAHITCVARMLRVATTRIAALIAAGEIHAHKRIGGKREFVLISNDEVDRINSLLDDAISHKAAARLLGISRIRLSQLHKKGLIGTRNAGAPPSAARYSVEDLSRFVTRLKIETSPYSRDQLETMAHICKFAAASEDEFIDLIQTLLNRGLSIYGHDEQFGSIGGLLLARSEWRAWREHIPQHPGFSVVEASAELGVKQEVAYHLLKMGMIKAYCGKSGRRMTKLLSFDSLEAFKQIYVSAVELATVHGTSPKAMIETLSHRKIFPITGPRVDGCRQYFYRRADFDFHQQEEHSSNADLR